MAQVYWAARNLRIKDERAPACLRSKAITSLMSGLPSSNRCQRASITQSILASGNASRKADAAGSAWMTSPRELRRTRRKRWCGRLSADFSRLRSGIALAVNARNHVARGMVFGIAANRGADAEKDGKFSLRNCVNGVIGALSVDVGLKFAEERVDVELIENNYVVYRGQRCYDCCAGSFGHHRAAGTFALLGAGIGIERDDEDVAFGLGGLKVANVADVEQVEDAICKDDFSIGAAVFFEDSVETFAGEDFFAGVHGFSAGQLLRGGGWIRVLRG